MKLIIVNGSHREGNSDLVIGELKRIGGELGLKIDELKLREIEMKMPDGCSQCAEGERCPNVDDEFEKKWLEKVAKYDGYVLVTPTWSDGPTPLMKIFIDRIVCFCHPDRKWWKDKSVGVITHGMAGKESWNMVIRWIESVCGWMEAKFVGSYTFKSGGKTGKVDFSEKSIKKFLLKFANAL